VGGGGSTRVAVWMKVLLAPRAVAGRSGPPSGGRAWRPEPAGAEGEGLVQGGMGWRASASVVASL